MAGKANLEVRPTFINKGEIARRIVEEHMETDTPPEFILCMGDDFTDEDMFRALNNVVSTNNNNTTANSSNKKRGLQKEQVFTVTVGASSKMTLASWHLLEPADVIATLGLLNTNGGGDDVVNGVADGDGGQGGVGMTSAKDVIQGVMPDVFGNTNPDPPAITTAPSAAAAAAADGGGGGGSSSS